jgi:phospholipase C
MPKENAMNQASSAAESRHSPPQESPNARKTGSAGAPASPIEHVVIIVKENHTFDNYFGTFPGAAGATEPHAADPETLDPPHDHRAWLHRDDPGPGGAHRLQYLKADIPAYWALAQQYTLCDQYFTEIASQSEPNHLVLIAGTTPLIDNSSAHRTYQPQPPYDINSLPSALKAAGHDWRAYSDDKLASYFRNIQALANDPWNVTGSQFDQDVARGFLPAVSWMYAPGNFSEHPGSSTANVGPGTAWTAARVTAVAKSALWPKMAIFITWDDWGGWYDHIAPPNVMQWKGGGPAGYQGSQFRYGSRVPCLVVSPYAKVGIDSTFHSHISIVKFCLRNFALPSLGGFDALPGDKSDNMWGCFDFAAPRRTLLGSQIERNSKPRRDASRGAPLDFPRFRGHPSAVSRPQRLQDSRRRGECAGASHCKSQGESLTLCALTRTSLTRTDALTSIRLVPPPSMCPWPWCR